MADTIKKINVKIHKDGKVEMDTITLGVQNEKNVTKLVFDIPEELNNYNKTIEFSFGEDKKVTDIILNNEYIIDNNISCNLFLSFQVVLTDTEGNEVFKSILKDCIFQKSINAFDPPPTPEEVSQWNALVNALNEKTREVDSLIKHIENQVEDGEFDGADGLTPYISNKYWYIGKENTEVKAEGTDGKDYILTEEDREEISGIVKTDIQPVLDGIEDISERAETIAKGRATGYVFDTLEELDLWLQDEENTSKLVLGDNLYIRAIGVPDYWWDGKEKQVLETQKVDLAEYVTQEEFNEDKIKRGEIVLSSASRTVEYEVIENGLYLVISHVSTNNDCIIYVVTKMGSNAIYYSVVKTGGYVTFALENRTIKVTGKYGIYTKIIKL